MRIHFGQPLLSFLLLVSGFCATASAGDAVTMALPPQTDLARLADLTAEFAGVSLQYNPQKVQGTVRLAVRGEVTPAELWEVFNQVLNGQGFTTVLTGLPPVYQVVPLAEAAGLGVALDAAQAAKIPYQPGYGVVILTLTHLSAEAAVKALSTLSTNQTSQVRTLGSEDRTVVISGPRAVLRQAQTILAVIDRAGVVPVVRLHRPVRASAQAIQASTTAAWTAIGRLHSSARPVEVQVAPDGQQLLLIASSEDIAALEALAEQLDKSEPVETRSYRPRHFGIDEVATLVQQLLKTSAPGGGIEVVRDTLTNSLIVKATTEQHRRVAEILAGLDDAPPTSRRQVRTLAVKHRQADELAKVLAGLIATGVVQSTAEVAHEAAAPTAGAPTATQPQPQPQPQPQAQPPQPPMRDTAPHLVSAGDNAVILTADTVTNSLIALGDPRSLDQVEALLKQLDQRQPQVDIEIIMVSLSDNQNQALGIELLKQITDGKTTGTVASLFGLSSPGPGSIVQGAASATGVGGVVLRPGDFAGVIQALETVTNGRQMVRSKVVVNNNAKAVVDGVVQEPLTSANSNGVSGTTTSFSGTSDAGTKIAVTPQISSADYVTVTYNVSQSSFLGESTVPGIPPTKRQDAVASVATVPDGSVIALGGLSNRGESLGEKRVPFLGGIPLLGALFRSRTTGQTDSRFYVFIRVNVMRHAAFADLRRISVQEAASAKIDNGEPPLEPQFIR